MCDTLFDPEDIPAEFRDCFDVVEVQCGAPWGRVTERTPTESRQRSWANGQHVQISKGKSRPGQFLNGDVRTLGWQPSCACPPHTPMPCLCLDPFNGSGTTGAVATGLGRRYVGLDLSRPYLDMADRRISRPHAPIAAERDEILPLFAGGAL